MLAIEKCPIEVQEAMVKITDCFNGDGGDFVKLCVLVNSLGNNLKIGKQPEATQQILDVIVQFSRLIDVAKKL